MPPLQYRAGLMSAPARYKPRQIVRDYLCALLNTGLYGTGKGDYTDVIDRLVCEGIEKAIRNGVIPRRKCYFPYERDHHD